MLSEAPGLRPERLYGAKHPVMGLKTSVEILRGAPVDRRKMLFAGPR